MKKYAYYTYIYKDFDYTDNYDVFYSLKEALDDMLQKFKDLGYKSKNLFVYDDVKDKYEKVTIENVEKYFSPSYGIDSYKVYILEEKKTTVGKIIRSQII